MNDKNSSSKDKSFFDEGISKSESSSTDTLEQYTLEELKQFTDNHGQNLRNLVSDLFERLSIGSSSDSADSIFDEACLSLEEYFRSDDEVVDFIEEPKNTLLDFLGSSDDISSDDYFNCDSSDTASVYFSDAVEEPYGYVQALDEHGYLDAIDDPYGYVQEVVNRGYLYDIETGACYPPPLPRTPPENWGEPSISTEIDSQPIFYLDPNNPNADVYLPYISEVSSSSDMGSNTMTGMELLADVAFMIGPLIVFFVFASVLYKIFGPKPPEVGVLDLIDSETLSLWLKYFFIFSKRVFENWYRLALEEVEKKNELYYFDKDEVLKHVLIQVIRFCRGFIDFIIDIIDTWL